MRIGIDISAVIYNTGVSHSVARSLEAILAIDKKNDYILYGGSLRRLSDLASFSNSLKGNYITKFFPIPPTLADVLWNRLKFPNIETLIGKHDVFHSSDWSQPPSSSFKVTTVHDLAPLKFPKLHDPKIVATHKRRLGRVKDDIDRVIVPSTATAEDVHLLGIPSSRIRVIPWASIVKPAKKSEVVKIKRKYKISGDFILSVGVNPRKNSERIIKAFDLISAGEDLKLVIVGQKHMKIEERRGVRFTGNIEDLELSALFTGAKALVYPSIYEGFGLPILDAFSTKTPVVTSNISSMPEVAGDAAILVNPYDLDSIGEGIRKALATSKTLIAKGMRRTKQYSWEKTARRILEVYMEGQ